MARTDRFLPAARWLKSLPLAFWLLVGVLLVLLPPVVAAVAGFAVLERDAIGRFADVTARYEGLVVPLHALRDDLREAARPVSHSLISEQVEHRRVYAAVSRRIDAGFERLAEAAVDHRASSGASARADLPAALQRARRAWWEADRHALELLEPTGTGAGALAFRFGRFDAHLDAASDHLARLEAGITRSLRLDRSLALAADAAVRRLAVAAGVVTLLFLLLGGLVIDRVILANLRRLARGVEAVAAGERRPRLAVWAPLELRRIAQVFHLMVRTVRSEEATLRERARTDGLTGLLDRREFDRRLDEELARGRRYRRATSLLLLDLDRFKAINDRHGHQAGDEVLRQVAEVVVDMVREIDQAFRYGGEELAIIAPDTDLAGAEALAERLRRQVRACVVPVRGFGSIRVSVSIGIAGFPQHGDDPAALITAADAALYAAKDAGRDRVVTAAARRAEGTQGGEAPPSAPPDAVGG